MARVIMKSRLRPCCRSRIRQTFPCANAHCLSSLPPRSLLYSGADRAAGEYQLRSKETPTPTETPPIVIPLASSTSLHRHTASTHGGVPTRTPSFTPTITLTPTMTRTYVIPTSTPSNTPTETPTVPPPTETPTPTLEVTSEPTTSGSG